MNLNKKILAVALLVAFLVPTVLVFGNPVPGGLQGEPPNVPLDSALTKITNFVFSVLMIVAVLFIIIAGFMFITASGNDDQVKKARSMLLYAVVGVIVALLAKGIVEFLQKSLLVP
jgi:type IV secretory pathway VirB2 component (pilin)